MPNCRGQVKSLFGQVKFWIELSDVASKISYYKYVLFWLQTIFINKTFKQHIFRFRTLQSSGSAFSRSFHMIFLFHWFTDRVNTYTSVRWHVIFFRNSMCCHDKEPYSECISRTTYLFHKERKHVFEWNGIFRFLTWHRTLLFLNILWGGKQNESTGKPKEWKGSSGKKITNLNGKQWRRWRGCSANFMLAHDPLAIIENDEICDIINGNLIIKIY